MTDAKKLLRNKFCQQGARVIKLQCDRAYFPDKKRAPRAIQLFALSPEQRAGLPTQNLLPERDFSHFETETSEHIIFDMI